MTRFLANLIASVIVMLAIGACIFALSGCEEPDRLYPIPERSWDIEARRPSPPPPPEEECGIQLVWDLPVPPLGECSPGWTDTCSGTSQPPVLPVSEISCNNRDDDCDGLVDENTAPSAVVVYMDWSGSMVGLRGTWRAAFCETQAPRTQWKLYAFGVQGEGSPFYELIADWAYGTQHICDAMQGDPWLLMSGRDEFAGEVIGTTAIDIDFPDGHNRHIVTITDEEPHPIDSPYAVGGTEIVAEKCQALKAQHWIFTYPLYYHLWADVTQVCPGGPRSITGSYQFLSDAITQVAQDGC